MSTCYGSRCMTVVRNQTKLVHLSLSVLFLLVWAHSIMNKWDVGFLMQQAGRFGNHRGFQLRQYRQISVFPPRCGIHSDPPALTQRTQGAPIACAARTGGGWHITAFRRFSLFSPVCSAQRFCLNGRLPCVLARYPKLSESELCWFEGY